MPKARHEAEELRRQAKEHRQGRKAARRALKRDAQKPSLEEKEKH
jgi:hypothetical protein